MKKLFSLALTLLLIFSVAAMAEEQSVYPLNEETFTLEQGPVWAFLYYDEAADEVFELHATPDWGDNWQFSENPSVDDVYHSLCEWDGVRAMPGTWLGQHIDIAAAFVAPRDGSVEIAPLELSFHPSDEEARPNYLLQIFLNDTVLLEGTTEDGWFEVPGTTEAISVDVVAGDLIAFIVRSGDNGGGAVLLEPVISYK